MNGPIRRLFLVALAMMIALAGSTSWWTVVRADALDHDRPSQNVRAIVRAAKIQRGTITAADGTVIARSERRADGSGFYTRRYPTRALFGHPVGYSFAETQSQAGLEAYYDEELAGRRSDVGTLVDDLRGRDQAGRRLRTTLDASAQALATRLIAQASPVKGGSAVALDPRTGAVRVMASVPGYDPADQATTRRQKRLAATPGAPLLNRAVQLGYAPGSTFKVVTLTAALDSGRFSASSRVDGTSGVRVSGVPLANDFDEDFGQIDLKTALTKSVNTAYAQVAEELGPTIMRRYMQRFGFDAKPQVDLPADAMSVPGERIGDREVDATDGRVDLGRLGIGQDRLQVPALQMAQVAAAVANRGTLMRPHIADRFVDADGRTTRRVEPEVQAKVMRPETAAAVSDAMVSVVTSGTGTQAQIPGIDVAGKTGTAETETGRDTSNKLWFIAFAPAQDPRIAIAVTVDDVRGFGGDVVAPIARQVMQELLAGG